MKIAYRLTKILLTLVVVVYVLALVVLPSDALFFNEGVGTFRNYVNTMLEYSIYLTPLAAIIFIPILTLRSFLAYKLDYTDKRTFMNRVYVALALEIVIIIIFIVIIGMALNPSSFKMIGLTMTGRYLSNDRGTSMIIVDGSPIVIKNMSGKVLFKDLSDGDLITVYYYEIRETYPARADIYGLDKKEDGSIDDIPKDVLESLIEMGWIESYEKE